METYTIEGHFRSTDCRPNLLSSNVQLNPNPTLMVVGLLVGLVIRETYNMLTTCCRTGEVEFIERFGEPPFLVLWPTILLCVPV